MAFILFFRISLAIFLFTLILQLKALPQLPSCKDSFPSSLLPNNSFEQYSGCFTDYGGMYEGGLIDYPSAYGGIKVNNWHTYTRDWTVNYFNYNCRTNKPGSIFDSTDLATACYFPKVPLPLPNGPGFIGITENDRQEFVAEKTVVKSYITACLSQPLYAGQVYLLNFYFGFGTPVSITCLQSYYQSQSPYSVAIFGRQDCPNFPLNNFDLSAGCLTNNTGWVQLGRVTLKGKGNWVQASIEFTPQTNIYSIGIGPDCTNNTYSRDFFNTIPIHYMDKFILAPKADFSFKTITAVSGNVCTGNFVLKAPTYANATYQWYKDGKLIPNATSQVYTVPDTPEAEGAYTTNITQPYNTCLNTLPFQVSFSDLQKFHLPNDTVLCAPAQIALDATWPDIQKYLWQDGSTNYTLTADKTGLYTVQLTDNKGCTKKDSVKVTVQGCEECELYTPSAFTPNNDGLNDKFKALPKCSNIGLQSFKMRIYNRWGQPVFSSSDIQTGWDGTFKRNPQDGGVYIYYIEYAFKKNQVLRKKGTIVLVR